jgi:pimeloyl-ACP methyl ester carboxylesterase
MKPTTTNTLFFGDNLDTLCVREHIADESIDLIYLDPPFNSKRAYNLLFKTPKGHTADIDRPLSLEQLVDDVAAAIRSLGLERADVFGYSMGVAMLRSANTMETSGPTLHAGDNVLLRCALRRMPTIGRKKVSLELCGAL